MKLMSIIRMTNYNIFKIKLIILMNQILEHISKDIGVIKNNLVNQ